MTTTPRLAMTQLVSGQAAPETQVNENDLILEAFGTAATSRAAPTIQPSRALRQTAIATS
jgi:hypothetical protein